MSDQNAALAHRWFEEVWNQGRAEAIDEMTASDAVGHGQAQHGVDIGMKEFRQLEQALRLAFPDINFVIHDTIAQGDRVVVRWVATMTHQGTFLGTPATGRKASITGTTILRIVDGKIVEGWDNWDQLGLLVQIGAVPKAEFVTAPQRQAKAS